MAHEIALELKERFSTKNWRFFSPDDLDLINKEITDQDNNSLIKNVTYKEIKDTIFDMPVDKSPGPNGFPADFFKHYWHIVGPSVCNAIKAFFHSGHILKEINHTFIALIQKIDNPLNINHYRPISLCNTIYKIITKILANRLKPLLDKIINPFHGAFVKGRLFLWHMKFFTHSTNRKEKMDGLL